MADYKQMKVINPADDPLVWWRERDVNLPILAHFARQNLSIPASSCPSESVFSTFGFIWSPRHSRLTGQFRLSSSCHRTPRRQRNWVKNVSYKETTIKLDVMQCNMCHWEQTTPYRVDINCLSITTVIEEDVFKW